MDIKKDIFYRPQLEIEHDYSTDGSILHDSADTTTPESNKTTNESLLEKSQKVVEQMLQIRKVLPVLPKDTADIIQDIIDKLIIQSELEQDQLDEIIEQEKKDEKEDKFVDVYENETESEPEPEESIIVDEDDFIWGDPAPNDITIKVIRCKSNAELAQDQYLKDSIYIKEDFANELNLVLQNYIYPLLTIMDESGIGQVEYLNLEYDGSSVTGYDSNDAHLNDTIVRNQVVLDESVKLFRKTHDANTTLSMITSFDVIAQERIRYYGEEYDLAISKFLDTYKRNILEKNRQEYDSKYLQAKTNMYKYLNSAVIITSDMLKNNLDTNSAKCYLLTKNINIFAKKEYEEAGYSNATNSSVNELDPEVKKATSTTKEPIETTETTENQDIK